MHWGDARLLEPFDGYIAPPLDRIDHGAIYTTAPVPTLEGVLNSKARPAHWSGILPTRNMIMKKVGWKYTDEAGPRGAWVYNTTLPGYGNSGIRMETR